MGTWGTGPFENDDACDWTFELEEGGPGLVVEAIEAAAEPDGGYLEADAAAYAIAAAEVVAALAGHARPDLPDEVAAWVGQHAKAPNAHLLDLARRAVERVMAQSELAELWDDSDHAPEWRKEVESLLTRLKHS